MGPWRTQHNGTWLDIAIRRVHPMDPLATDILKDAHIWLNSPWDSKLDSETPEFRSWLFTLWENSIRINLGQGKVQEAINLIIGQPNISQFNFSNFNSDDRVFFPPHSKAVYSFENMLRWLAYTGDIPHARIALDAIIKIHPRGFYKWRSLLATDFWEASTPGTYNKIESWEDGLSNDATVWRAMVDEIPTESLYYLATNPDLTLGNRALISRAILTRALILNLNEDEIDRYAALAAKLNPNLREEILSSTSRHDKSDYVTFLLKLPRFRLSPNLDYAVEVDNAVANPKTPTIAPDAIDAYNHNDNNWWCKYNSENIWNKVLRRAIITPTSSKLFSSPELPVEFSPYIEIQKVFLSNHPYHSILDTKEITELEKVSSGPQFLSEYVIKNELAKPIASTPEEINLRASDLYRAVRTTRYGCNQNGPHGQYSKKAFELIHSRYEDTPWAKATPYWFN